MDRELVLCTLCVLTDSLQSVLYLLATAPQEIQVSYVPMNEMLLFVATQEYVSRVAFTFLNVFC